VNHPFATPRAPVQIRMSEVISALSYALDLVEGQPNGHAARSCILGMRIAREIGLPAYQMSALFYALLLKDLGCSSNASKVCYLFGADDRATKCDLKTTDWTSLKESMKYVAIFRKASRFAAVAAGGQKVARQLVQIRCQRGANIARSLGLPEIAAQAIHNLDEHFDGSGHPDGLAGEQIPLLARILNLAQTAEVFWQKGGAAAACDVAAERCGTWFDPQLTRALTSLRDDEELWHTLGNADPAATAAALEPQGDVVIADESTLDCVAEGFAQVIDAKSPWTFCHSAGVADISTGIASILGINGRRLANLRRAALLHDIGKLGVSNLILDKPGKLDPEELAAMRKHSTFTRQILERVTVFAPFAELAASHHERLDGRGYHRGIAGGDLGLETRILAVADIYEALAAKRPYRQDLTQDDVLNIIKKESGVALCPAIVSALNTFLAQSHFTPFQVAA
jgi:HD-GYP domain-containing protein (c-di-GMP phosphodiesterase class II)